MFEPIKSYLDSRQDFERIFNILAELLREGKMHFSFQSIKTIESLKKIRKLPNGRLDLSTINELSRTTAMMASNFENMKEKAEKNEE
jgi:hypothetical protein